MRKGIKIRMAPPFGTSLRTTHFNFCSFVLYCIYVSMEVLLIESGTTWRVQFALPKSARNFPPLTLSMNMTSISLCLAFVISAGGKT